MRIAILYNPRAGKGRGAAFVPELDRALASEGHRSRTLDVTSAAGGVPSLLEWAQAVVIVGGDGTLHHSLPALLRTSRPVYHAAMGTENLFAREFGHVADVRHACSAMSSARTRRIDIAGLKVPHSATVPFAIMASVGPDASIIHRLSSRRSGPIRHASYLRPIVSELATPFVPQLTVRVDDRCIVDGRRGMVVVANLRQYALRLDPAASADPSDGRLDVVFVPGRSLPSIALSLAAWRLGGRSDVVAARGQVVEVVKRGEMLIQVDGEAVANPAHGVELPSLGTQSCAMEIVGSLFVFVV